MFCKSSLNLGNNCFYLVSRVMYSDSSLWGGTETTETSAPLKFPPPLFFICFAKFNEWSMKHHVYEKRTKLNLYWSGEFTWGMTSRVIPVFHSGCVTWHKETAFSTTEGTVALVYPYKKGIYTRNDFDITCCRGIQNSCQLWTWYRRLACGGPRSVVSDANYRASIGSS